MSKRWAMLGVAVLLAVLLVVLARSTARTNPGTLNQWEDSEQSAQVDRAPEPSNPHQDRDGDSYAGHDDPQPAPDPNSPATSEGENAKLPEPSQRDALAAAADIAAAAHASSQGSSSMSATPGQTSQDSNTAEIMGVLKSWGRAVGDTPVTLSDTSGDVVGTVITNAEGEFSFASLAAGVYRVEAFREGYAPVFLEASLEVGAVRHIELRLNQGASVEGRVRFNGRPAADVRVEGGTVGAGYTADTDSDGRYRLTGLVEGEYAIGVNWVVEDAPHRLRNYGRRIRVAAESITELNFDIDEGDAAIEGMVTVDGEVPQELVVRTTSADGFGSSATVNDDGTFALSGISPGHYDLEISVRTGESWIYRTVACEAASQQITRCDVALSTGNSVYGFIDGLLPDEILVVFAIAGEFNGPVTDYFAFWDSVRGMLVVSTVQLTTGEFQLDGLEPGIYTLVAFAREKPDVDNGGATEVRSATATIEVPQAAPIDLPLPPRQEP